MPNVDANTEDVFFDEYGIDSFVGTVLVKN